MALWDWLPTRIVFAVSDSLVTWMMALVAIAVVVWLAKWLFRIISQG